MTFIEFLNSLLHTAGGRTLPPSLPGKVRWDRNRFFPNTVAQDSLLSPNVSDTHSRTPEFKYKGQCSRTANTEARDLNKCSLGGHNCP